MSLSFLLQAHDNIAYFRKIIQPTPMKNTMTFLFLFLLNYSYSQKSNIDSIQVELDKTRELFKEAQYNSSVDSVKFKIAVQKMEKLIITTNSTLSKARLHHELAQEYLDVDLFMSISQLTKAIEYDDHIDYYDLRAFCYQKLGMHHEAANDLKMLLTAMQGSNKGILLKVISMELFASNEYSEAILYFNKWEQFLKEALSAGQLKKVEVEEDYSELYIKRGISYSFTGNKIKACTDLNTALIYAPDAAKEKLNSLECEK